MPKQTRIALITGGSRGLGRNTVLSLAKRGVRSIFTYNSSRGEADKVTATAEEAGCKAIALKLDAGNVGTFDSFVDSVRSALVDLSAERFDYLVNNAGLSHHNAFAKTTEAELDQLYNVNFKGVFFLTQKLLPLINDGGRIVNISTGLTRFTTPDTIPYASLKGAVEVFTHYLAGERAGSPRHYRQCCRSWRDRYGLQRWHRSGQSGGEQARRRHDGAGPRRRARRHRTDDCLAAFRR